MRTKLILFLPLFLFMACTAKKEIFLDERPLQSDSKSFFISEPLSFDSIESLQEYASQPLTTKTADGFVSYLETVMAEPGYEDTPDAILSKRFGAILNADGEVIVAGYFAKLNNNGIVIGPETERDLVRFVASKMEPLSLIQEPVLLPALNPYKTVYRLKGYPDIYLFDLFGKKQSEMTVESGLTSNTKSMAPNLVVYNRTLASLNMTLDPYADFTVPPSGSQKVLFDDTHCNDTKIWQKEYFFIMDSGIKVKTMEKNSIGIWSKFRNPIEGGVSKWVIQEHGEFEDIVGSTVDINKVNYDNRNHLPRNVYTINARGCSLGDIMSRNLQQLLDEGNALSNSNNLSVYVEGVRFVISDTIAYTRFPDRVDSANWLTIDQDWPTPFAGEAYSNTSYLLQSQKLRNRVYYYTWSAVLYGQSTWNGYTVGSKMVYTYN